MSGQREVAALTPSCFGVSNARMNSPFLLNLQVKSPVAYVAWTKSFFETKTSKIRANRCCTRFFTTWNGTASRSARGTHIGDDSFRLAAGVEDRTGGRLVDDGGHHIEELPVAALVSRPLFSDTMGAGSQVGQGIETDVGPVLPLDFQRRPKILLGVDAGQPGLVLVERDIVLKAKVVTVQDVVSPWKDFGRRGRRGR